MQLQIKKELSDTQMIIQAEKNYKAGFGIAC